MKKNERNAGRKPKYQKGIETITIHIKIPKELKNECLEVIDNVTKIKKNEK